MITVIPKKSITRMKMLYDPKGRTMEQWHRDYGFDYGINTVLFELDRNKNGEFDLCGILDIDGKRLRDVALDYGFGIKNNSLVFSYDNLAKCPDFAAFAYSVLVRDGEIEVTQAESGKRGLQWRSAVGINEAGDIILFCQHANRSLMGIAGDMQAAGCTVAGNYDGGGSSNLWTPGAQLLTTRPLPAILAIWTGEQEDKPDDTTEEENNMLKVLLIAGHGDGDPGAVANGIQEADETRAIVSNLDTQLEGICQVTTYPTERNAYKDLKAGALAVNWSDYDYVLEIHFNAFDGAPSDGKTKGVECYVTRAEPGTAVEEAICKNIASLGLTNRGVKRKNYDVIQSARLAGVSSALLEVCFLDDPDDMEIYQANKTAIATAIAAGIVSGFGLQATKPEQPQPWYQEAMEWVMAEGISNGDRPTDAATRADVWAMLLRFFRVLGGV